MIRTRALAFSRFCFTQTLPLMIAAVAIVAVAGTLHAQTAPPTPPPPAAPAAPPTAPPTPLPTVPDSVKRSTDVAPNRAQIEQFIKQAVAQLGGNTPDAQNKARQALINEAFAANDRGQNVASPAYLDVYAQILNKELLTLKGHPSARVRLNAAIVCAAVAQQANNAQLKDAAVMFVQDPSEAVVLWGIKAARWIIPAQLGQVAAQPDLTLVNEIVPAVRKHSKGTIGGAIAIDAFDALTLGIPGNPGLVKNIKAAVIKIMIVPVQDLLAFRVGLYEQGVPPEPRAEKFGANFLTIVSWGVQTPDQKLKSMQLLSNLVSLAAAQAQQANTADLNELIGLIQLTAKCMTVAVGPGKTTDALAPATLLGRGSGPQQIKAAVDAIFPALQADPTFKAITAPPAVKGHEAAPPPASAPTTGPVIIPGVGTPPVAPPGAAPVPPAPPAGTRPATRPIGGTTTPPAPPPRPTGPTGGGTTTPPRPTTPTGGGTTTPPPKR